MDDSADHWSAGKCLESLRVAVELSEFGFLVQGLAAHIVLRLGSQILAINATGHPDIVAQMAEGMIRIEVEADTQATRGRALTQEDLAAIAPRSPTDKGYFAVAVCGHYPRWVLVEYTKVRRRQGVPALPAILEALADQQLSILWTQEFIKLLVSNCQRLGTFTFDFLARRALDGRPL